MATPGCRVGSGECEARWRHLDVGRRRGRASCLTALQEVPEGPTELGGHCVVEDRVNGAVHVDHETTEEYEPVVGEPLCSERVVYYVDAVGHPESGEHTHDDR